MKKVLAVVFSLILLILFLGYCKKKVEVSPPSPPAVEEAPKIEEKEVEKVPVVKEPELTEEEIFRMKTLEELNRESPLEMIHFDFDRYFIRDDAKPVLEKNSRWLQSYLTVKILIEGHCDERGTEEYNMALGEKRAKSTRDYLMSLGISPDRIRIISYGKTQPLDPGHNEEAWAKNRRAQFLITEK